jgi:hypothetical protein
MATVNFTRTAAYQKPQTIIIQRQVEETADSPPAQKTAFIGGYAQVVKYGSSTEGDGWVGPYQGESNFYSWPERLNYGTSVIDEAYTKVFVRNGLFEYFDKSETGAVVQFRSGTINVVEFPSLLLAGNTSGANRSSVFGNRDVQSGDIVVMELIAENSLGQIKRESLTTAVETLIPEGEPGSVDQVESSGMNQRTVTSAEAAITVETLQVASSYSIESGSVSQYDGRNSRGVEDVYYIKVIQSSSNGDLTTARLRITTDSGYDQIDSLQAGANGTFFAIGNPVDQRGLKIRFVGIGDLLKGDSWKLTVKQPFYAPTVTAQAASSGYTGTESTSYLVTVTTGGTYESGKIRLSSQTIDGQDVVNEIPVTALNTPVTISPYGIQLLFHLSSGAVAGQSGLCKGDVYVVTVTASDPTAGEIHAFRLRNNIPASFVNFAGTNGQILIVELKLALVETTELPATVQGIENWTQNDDGVTLSDTIRIYTDSVLVGGQKKALPLLAANGLSGKSEIYVQYRNWLSSTTTTGWGEINSVSELEAALPGAIDPDNPLKYAIYAALLTRSNGNVGIFYANVGDPSDLENWQQALDATKQSIEAYNLVPLSTDPAVRALVYNYVIDLSTAERGLERVAWFGLELNDNEPVLQSVGKIPIAATIGRDTSTSLVQYNELNITTNGADLVEAGVKAGDVVRYHFTTDLITGESLYATTVVKSVVNANTVRVATKFTGANAIPQKIEIWRLTRGAEIVGAVQRQIDYSDRRVRYVFPDAGQVGGYDVSGLEIAGILANLTSNVSPHQSLTLRTIPNLTNLSRVKNLSDAELDALALSGVWIVTTDLRGNAYTRHGLTSGEYENLQNREEVLVRNEDNITQFIRSRVWASVPSANISRSVLSQIDAVVRSALMELQGRYVTEFLGGQIVSYEITQPATQNRIHKDTVDIECAVYVQSPMNVLRIGLNFQVWTQNV